MFSKLSKSKINITKHNKLKKSKKKLNNKIKITFLILIIIIVIFLIFFSKKDYKNLKLGNNSIEEIEEYILNISSYEAKIEATINSNKNTNKYVIMQTYEKTKQTKQVVLEPSNIEGLEIEYNGQNLILKNTRLNLEKVYENYEYLIDNFITLESFISDYTELKESNKTSIYEEENNVIMEVKEKVNKYICKKTLYIDKNTAKPSKLLVQDINGENIVYILYNEIEIK